MTQESKTEEQQKPQKRKIIIPAVVAACVLGVSYVAYQSQFQSTDDAYVEADIIQVTPKVSGHIVESYVKDNMEVKEGDIVAKIDDELYQARYQQAREN